MFITEKIRNKRCVRASGDRSKDFDRREIDYAKSAAHDYCLDQVRVHAETFLE